MLSALSPGWVGINGKSVAGKIYSAGQESDAVAQL